MMARKKAVAEADAKAVIREERTGIIMRSEGFVCTIPDGVTDSLFKRMEKLRDARDDWPGFMYRELERRTKFSGKTLKLAEVDVNDVLTVFGEKFVELTGFDTTSPQRTIKEAVGGEKNG